MKTNTEGQKRLIKARNDINDILTPTLKELPEHFKKLKKVRDDLLLVFYEMQGISINNYNISTGNCLIPKLGTAAKPMGRVQGDIPGVPDSGCCC